MPDNEQQGEGEQPPRERIMRVPERVLRKYVAQLNDAVRNIREEKDKEIAALRAEIEVFKKRPLADWAKDMGGEAKDAILEKMKSGEMNNAVESFVTPIVVQKTVEMQNRIDGTHMETVDEIIKAKEAKRRKNRRRNRILGVVGAVGLAAVAAIAGWALYDSSKRTAEGAAGTANAALKVSHETRTSFGNYKTADAKWKTDYDAAKKKDDEARKSELSGLETKLTGEIAKKADGLEIGAKIADLKKNYETVDAALKAELAKNKSREGAYTSYKELAEATKKSLDALALEAATRKYTDEEFDKLRKNLADADGNIKKYGGLITQLQTDSGANANEAKRLADLYDALLRNYQAIAERMKKLEEEREKEKPKSPLLNYNR